MKIVEVVDPMEKGDIGKDPLWLTAWNEVQNAIALTDWPHGKGKFLLNPGTSSHANGVKPIKKPCMDSLRRAGWKTEQLPEELAGVKIGNLDALKDTEKGPIGFEWETGNISSIHRAVNKIVLAIANGGLLGGFLIVPSENMRRYITDRIGNITELREYFDVWKRIAIDQGILRIAVVEYDALDKTVPFIGKGGDGMAPKK